MESGEHDNSDLTSTPSLPLIITGTTRDGAKAELSGDSTQTVFTHNEDTPLQLSKMTVTLKRSSIPLHISASDCSLLFSDVTFTSINFNHIPVIDATSVTSFSMKATCKLSLLTRSSTTDATGASLEVPLVSADTTTLSVAGASLPDCLCTDSAATAAALSYTHHTFLFQHTARYLQWKWMRCGFSREACPHRGC